MFQHVRFYSHISILLALACLFYLVPGSEAAAIGEQPDPQPLKLDDDTPGAGAMRMFVSLLAVLALIAGGVFLLKKLTPTLGCISNAEHSISVLSRATLGQKKSICLVKVADEILVIGLTNTNISVLSKMNADEYYSRNGRNTQEVSTEHKQSFRKVLDKIGIRNHRTSTAREEGQ